MEIRFKGTIRWIIAIGILTMGSILQAANAGAMSEMLLFEQSEFVQLLFGTSATLIAFFGSWINWLLITLVTYMVSDFICQENKGFGSHLYWNGIGYAIILVGAAVTRILLNGFIASFWDSAAPGSFGIENLKNLPEYRRLRTISAGATITYFLWSSAVARRLNSLKWFQAPIIAFVLLGLWFVLRAVANA